LSLRARCDDHDRPISVWGVDFNDTDVFPFSGEPNGLHQFLHGLVQWTQNQDPSSWLTLQRHAIEASGDDIIGEH
jgi:hypothetical protein